MTFNTQEMLSAHRLTPVFAVDWTWFGFRNNCEIYMKHISIKIFLILHWNETFKTCLVHVILA